MKTMGRGWVKKAKYLMIAASIAVPAVVAAQQAQLPNPNPFVGGQVLTASSLSDLRTAVNTLIGRVNTLEGQGPSWGQIEPLATITTNGTTSIGVPSPEFLSAIPVGSNFGAIDVFVRVGSVAVSRGNDGSGATVAVNGNETVTLETSGVSGNQVSVVFRPLVLGD